MICPGCLRDVPDLIDGPEETLCPECLGISADDLIPSLLESLAAMEEEEELATESQGPSRNADDAWEEEASFLLDRLDELEPIEDDYPPMFGGRPRF
jgi:hypothetical protein